MIGSSIAGAGQAAGGLIGGITSAIMAGKQHKLQQEQYAYQKQLNERMMQREDSAVQRRMADLEKAGLSKNLATGAGFSAQTSPMSSGNPLPSGNDLMSSGMNSIGSSIGTGLQSASTFMDIANAVKQGRNIDANTATQEADAYLKYVEALTEAKKQGLISAQTAEILLRNKINESDFRKSEKLGIRHKDDISSSFVDGLNKLDFNPKRLLQSGAIGTAKHVGNIIENAISGAFMGRFFNYRPDNNRRYYR